MVGAGADDAHLDAVLLVPAGVAIDDVDAVPGVEVVDGTLTVDFPDLRIDMSDILVSHHTEYCDFWQRNLAMRLCSTWGWDHGRTCNHLAVETDPTQEHGPDMMQGG
jgi:hypothetical protein